MLTYSWGRAAQCPSTDHIQYPRVRLGWSVFLPGLIQCPQWLQFDFMLLVKDWEGEVLPQDGVMKIIQTT